jgi:hypothetical protein
MDVYLAVGESIRLGEAGTLHVLAVEGDLILFELAEPEENRPGTDDEGAERRLLSRHRDTT